MGIFTSAVPRDDVLQDELNDAIFAADFGDLIAGHAPDVYGKAATFFENTHPARQLQKVVQTVFGRLANPHENGATVRLSTGFGGGKTHTLMALWHLALNTLNLALGTELLPAAGRPQTTVHVAAIDAGKAGLPVFARHGSDEVGSLWGEIAYQLGGAQAWQRLRDAGVDAPDRQPDEALLRSVIPQGPVLILLDELVIYMAMLPGPAQGSLLNALNKLMAIAAARPQMIVVVTDPGTQAAYAGEAALLKASTEAAVKLDEVFGRKAADFDPIGDEAAQVIARRLFSTIDPAAAQAASAVYHATYQRVAEQYPGTLPSEAIAAGYAQRIVQCYPFHPRLLDTAQDRLGAIGDFQKSRGVLRFFARLIRDTWQAEEDLELITAGELNWSSQRLQSELLQRLNRDAFKAAVSADVERHATELDGGMPHGVHRRVASALLLESLPMQPSSGLDEAQATLATLRPSDAGNEPAEALHRLSGVCWHTYNLPSGTGWQFRYLPNVNKQVEERMAKVPEEDGRSRVHTAAQAYFSGATFRRVAWPSGPRQVPDTATLQLALCDDEATARDVTAHGNTSEPGAPMPRGFKNAIVAVAPSPAAYQDAIRRARYLAALEAIEKETDSGDAGKSVREQLQKLKPDYTRQARLQAYRAFDRVVLSDERVLQMEERYQVPEEDALKAAQGQPSLLRFLQDKELIYKPDDALDPGVFVGVVLSGAIEVAGQEAVYTGKAVHERFLSVSGLRLVPGAPVVHASIAAAVKGGAVAVRLDSGDAYDANGRVYGADGRRRRESGALPVLPLDDKLWISPAGSAAAAAWLHVDPVAPVGPDNDGNPPPPPPPKAEPTTTDAASAAVLAGERPLLALDLVAAAPVAAALLATLAQPFGADTLALDVTVNGDLKGGGTAAFAAGGLRFPHPTKPFDTASALHRAMESGSATFEAVLHLSFAGEGRTGLAALFEQLAGNLPPDMTISARFGAPPATA